MRKILCTLFTGLLLIFSLGIAHGAGTPGTVKWSYTTGSCITSSPAIGADGTIYVGSDDTKLYAINPDGTLKWSYATGCAILLFSRHRSRRDHLCGISRTPNSMPSIPTGPSSGPIPLETIVSSPAIGADGTIYVGSWDSNLYAINPNGTLKWSYATGYGIDSSPAIGADGTIYVGSVDHNLYAINPNGTLKWSYTMGSYINSSPAIGADGTIYVGSVDTKLYAINPNGTLKWSYATGGVLSLFPRHRRRRDHLCGIRRH